MTSNKTSTGPRIYSNCPGQTPVPQLAGLPELPDSQFEYFMHGGKYLGIYIGDMELPDEISGKTKITPVKVVFMVKGAKNEFVKDPPHFFSPDHQNVMEAMEHKPDLRLLFDPFSRSSTSRSSAVNEICALVKYYLIHKGTIESRYRYSTMTITEGEMTLIRAVARKNAVSRTAVLNQPLNDNQQKEPLQERSKGHKRTRTRSPSSPPSVRTRKTDESFRSQITSLGSDPAASNSLEETSTRSELDVQYQVARELSKIMSEIGPSKLEYLPDVSQVKALDSLGEEAGQELLVPCEIRYGNSRAPNGVMQEVWIQMCFQEYPHEYPEIRFRLDTGDEDENHFLSDINVLSATRNVVPTFENLSSAKKVKTVAKFWFMKIIQKENLMTGVKLWNELNLGKNFVDELKNICLDVKREQKQSAEKLVPARRGVAVVKDKKSYMGHSQPFPQNETFSPNPLFFAEEQIRKAAAARRQPLRRRPFLVSSDDEFDEQNEERDQIPPLDLAGEDNNNEMSSPQQLQTANQTVHEAQFTDVTELVARQILIRAKEAKNEQEMSVLEEDQQKYDEALFALNVRAAELRMRRNQVTQDKQDIRDQQDRLDHEKLNLSYEDRIRFDRGCGSGT